MCPITKSIGAGKADLFFEHGGKRPRIHRTAHVAPTATISGDVTIGPETCVLFGAVITADGGPVVIGRQVVVMENAVIRGTPKHATRIGDHVLVGPRAYLTGCTVHEDAFLATGATVFNGSVIERRVEVRINGVVHLKTRVPEGVTVPIGWVAVGDPVLIAPAKDHEAIWAIQEVLDFPMEVFGVDRPPEGETRMPDVTRRYTRFLRRHRDDVILGPDDVLVDD